MFYVEICILLGVVVSSYNNSETFMLEEMFHYVATIDVKKNFKNVYQLVTFKDGIMGNYFISQSHTMVNDNALYPFMAK